MKIAIIGAGAMGSIYGGHLSLCNDVYLVDKNEALVKKINEEGLTIKENGQDNVYKPTALVDSSNLETMDLIILFVKSLFSKAALDENKHLIGPDTYLMTLQNGAGHEDLLSNYAPMDHLIIGTTEDNGAPVDLAVVKRGGMGRTNIGMLETSNKAYLDKVKESFDACGFDTLIHDNIQQLIWEKLLINTSLSAVTGLLQCKIGYIYENKNAWQLTLTLVDEAVAVAKSLQLEIDADKVIGKLEAVAVGSKEGITSICNDIRQVRKTEVDTISGAVIKAASANGLEVPAHHFIVDAIHALETRENFA